MPQNGRINETFGVYKSTCCGSEIIIVQGATFPHCPNHRKQITEWRQVDIQVTDRSAGKKESESDPAA